MIKFIDEKKITALDAWSIYTAMTLHFSAERKYDAIKYHFKGPHCSTDKFNANKQRYLFEKLVKKYPYNNLFIGYCLANIIDNKQWITDFSDLIYTQWLGKIQGLNYKFKTDIANLAETVDDDNLSFDECIKPKNPTDMPIIYKQYKTGSFSIESLVCLNFILHFIDDFKFQLKDPMKVSENISYKIEKYTPFLISIMDPEKYTTSIISSFTF